MLASKGHGLIVIISKKKFFEVIRVIGCRTVLCIFPLDTAIQVTQKMAGFIENMVYRKPAKGLHTSSVKSVLGRLPLEYNAVFSTKTNGYHNIFKV